MEFVLISQRQGNSLDIDVLDEATIEMEKQLRNPTTIEWALTNTHNTRKKKKE